MMIRRAALLVISALLVASGSAQKLASRLVGPITDGQRVALVGSKPAVALAEADLGAVSPSMQLTGVSMAFKRSDQQEAALQALIAAQQDIFSPMYHQWLSPEEFGAQFGVSDADLEKVTTWLQLHGFTVGSVSRSRNSLTFSGSASQIAGAFGTELHNYNIQNETHFAPNAELT
jgi:subtilase family serine protease